VHKWNDIMDDLAALPSNPIELCINIPVGSDARAINLGAALDRIGMTSPWSITYCSRIRRGSEILHKVGVKEEPLPGIYKTHDLIVRVQDTG